MKKPCVFNRGDKVVIKKHGTVGWILDIFTDVREYSVSPTPNLYEMRYETLPIYKQSELEPFIVNIEPSNTLTNEELKEIAIQVFTQRVSEIWDRIVANGGLEYTLLLEVITKEAIESAIVKSKRTVSKKARRLKEN